MRSRDRWQRPTIPRVHDSGDGPGVKSDPNMHRAHKRPTQSADRSTATRVASGETSAMTWETNESILLSADRGKPMELSERSSKSGGMENTRLDIQNHPLRNEAQLNCVALRSSLDCEVTGEAVKGQDERPLRGALDSPASHHRTSMLTSENKLRRAATSALTFMTFS
jgi:hypothetical protein